MKKIILLFLAIFLIQAAYAEDMYDFDMQFLDNPFAGQKIITPKEFNDVTQKMTKKKEPSKFSKWLWGVNKKKNEVDPNLQKQYGSMPSELGSVKDSINSKPVVTLGTNIVDSEGRTLPCGHYQVDFRDNFIVFLQAHQTMGRFRAMPYKDSYKSNKIIYARLIEEQKDVYKIIFSDLDGTYQGFARIIE